MTATRAHVGVDAQARYTSAHATGRALAELCRLQISRVPCLVMVVAAIAVGRAGSEIVAGIVFIAAMCAIGAALNDRADVVSDRVNGRFDRPLVNGALAPRHVTIAIVGAAVVAVLTQLWIPQPTGIASAAVAAAVGWASAKRPLELQARNWIGLVVLAFSYLVLPIMLAAGLGAFVAASPLLFLGAGALAHKDVRDEAGDRAAGKRTVLVAFGYRPMAIIATTSAGVGAAGLLVTIGVGWWTPTAAAALIGLAAMVGLGHRPHVWLAVRMTTVATACLVSAHIGAQAIG